MRLTFFIVFSVLLAGLARAQDEQVTFWTHNGSILNLTAHGSVRQFRYVMPREGMLKVGARPDDPVFSGNAAGNRYIGNATIYSAKCGRHNFKVSGPILDDGSKVVLRGRAPRLTSACKAEGTLSQTWTFNLIEPAEMPAEFQGQWQFRKNKTDSCSAGAVNIFDAFRVGRKSVRGFEWGCDFITVTKTQDGAVALKASCGNLTEAWIDEGVWRIHDDILSMSAVSSIIVDSEAARGEDLRNGTTSSMLATRCTQAPDKSDVPVMH